MDEYFEEFNLLLPGELKSIKFNNNKNSFEIINDEHYSRGARLRVEEICETRYLKHETGFIHYKDNRLTTTIQFDKNSVIYLKSSKNHDNPFKLKCKEGYINEALELCNEESEAYNFQLIWCDLTEPEDHQDLTNSKLNNEINFISTDGVSLISNKNSLFHCILNRELLDHAQFFDDDNSLMFNDEHSDDIKFKFELVDEKVLIYSTDHGYLDITTGEYYDDEEVEYVVFSQEIHKSRVALFKTDQLGTYKLESGSRFVKVLGPEEFPNCILVDSYEDASDFQFLLINEEYVFDI